MISNLGATNHIPEIACLWGKVSSVLSTLHINSVGLRGSTIHLTQMPLHQIPFPHKLPFTGMFPLPKAWL